VIAGAFGISLVGVAWVVLLNLIISTLEKQSIKYAYAAIEKLTAALAHAIPTAGRAAEVALLMAGASQTRVSFTESADKIVNKIDGFAAESVTPTAAHAFDLAITRHISPSFERMETTLREVSLALLEKQDNGLKVLADSFSDRLFTTIDDKMERMGRNVDNVNTLLAETASKFEIYSKQIAEGLANDRKALGTASDIAARTAEAQYESAENIKAFASYLTEAKLVTESVKEQNERILSSIKEASELTLSMTESHIGRMNETKAEHARQYENGRAEQAKQLAETKNAVSASITEMREALSGALNDMQAAVRDNGASLADTFTRATDNLQAAVKDNSASLADTFTKATDNLQAAVSDNSSLMTGALSGASQAVKEAYELSNRLVAENIAANENRFGEYLNEALARASEQENRIKDYLTQSAEDILGALKHTSDQNADLSAKLGATIDSLANAGSEQYEKAAQAAASLLQNVVVEMNRAMDGVGKQISESIGATIGDSAEMVEKLAVQMSTLKQEYDAYFTKADEQNRTAFDELDFHMQNVIARFSTETETVISKLQESISSAMGLFEGNTATLLANLDEQSRSIGLYAKELNYDIHTLSDNLKGSVAEFSDHLHKGVVTTFEDFDAGLSEVAKRFANMVESVRDSVENLPAALSGNRAQ